jgi:hypothetical protein
MDRDKLQTHIRKLIKDGLLDGKIIETNDGDRYHHEHGENIKFKILDKKYSIGYVYTTEDDDDWAQAECYESKWCLCNNEYINPKELYEIVENRKSIERESKIKSLGI